MQHTEWKLHPVVGSRTVHRLDLHDRVIAHVDVRSWRDTGEATYYHWSVQDGSRGKVLDQGWVDGEEGLDVAKRAAADCAMRLFPHLSLL